MIHIKKSPTADTRTRDWSKVTKLELFDASHSHRRDVRRAMAFLVKELGLAAAHHDDDKVSDEGLEAFHADFITGFKQTGWFENHLKVNRHHIDKPEGVCDDVNLIDVLEHIADCVMAGMARSGSVYDIDLPPELLAKAVKNTVELLKAQVVIDE